MRLAHGRLKIEAIIVEAWLTKKTCSVIYIFLMYNTIDCVEDIKSTLWSSSQNIIS